MYRQEKNDCVVSTRLKSTTLATIGRFFAKKGVVMQNKSFLVRLAVEEFEGVLIRNALEERVMDIIDARKVLAKLGLENLNPDGRGGKNFMEEQQRAVYEFEGWDASEIGQTRTKTSVEAELKGIVTDPVQMKQVLDDVKSYTERTERQEKRSQEERSQLSMPLGSVEVVE